MSQQPRLIDIYEIPDNIAGWVIAEFKKDILGSFPMGGIEIVGRTVKVECDMFADKKIGYTHGWWEAYERFAITGL